MTSVAAHTKAFISSGESPDSAGYRTVVVPGEDAGEEDGLADGLPGAGANDSDSPDDKGLTAQTLPLAAELDSWPRPPSGVSPR